MIFQRTKTLLLLLFLISGLYACGSDVGGKEDQIAPVVSLATLGESGEVVGTVDIIWDIRTTV